MAVIKKIEDRTIWFIGHYDALSKAKRLPTNVELAKIMGMESKSTVTNILKKAQNIQPEQWERFKNHFGIAEDAPRSQKNEQDATAMQILAGLTEGFKAIAETMRSIESKMAREETLTTMDASLKRTLAAALTVAKGQEDAMKELRNLFSQAKAQKTDPSGGSGKGRGRRNGGFEKTGKSPA